MRREDGECAVGCFIETMHQQHAETPHSTHPIFPDSSWKCRAAASASAELANAMDARDRVWSGRPGADWGCGGDEGAVVPFAAPLALGFSPPVLLLRMRAMAVAPSTTSSTP